MKERNTKIRDELTDVNHQIDITKTKIDAQSKYIKDLQELNELQYLERRPANRHRREI